MVADLVKRNEDLEAELASVREAYRHAVSSLGAEIKSLETKLATSEQERQLLARLLKNFRARSYGRTSEKLSPGQQTFGFFAELVEEATSEVEEEIDEESGEDTKPKRRAKRRRPQSIPESIERERVELDVDRELRICSSCQVEMQRLGEDVTTEIDYIPGRFIAREYVRPKYACRNCQQGVLQEALPRRPIRKGLPGFGLLTQILVAKYVEHMPLYRQEKAFLRQGLEISRSTLSGWVQAMADLLRPIWEALKREVLSSSLIQADETPVKVLNKQGVKKGYLWTFGIPWEEVVFDFSEGRAGVFAETFLGGYEGHVQCDAYSGYDRLESKRIVRLGCWAHARRCFFDARSEGRTAQVALAAIQQLYRFERQARGEKLSGEALVSFRREHAKPVLEKLEAYLRVKRLEVLPKSLTGEAIQYALGNWPTLERYVEVPLAQIDNCSAEQSIRPIALGRKNWLFLGHRNAGPRAATILSLVVTCLRLRIDPALYLREVIEEMTIDPSRAPELTPRRWRARRELLVTENTSVASAS